MFKIVSTIKEKIISLTSPQSTERKKSPSFFHRLQNKNQFDNDINVDKGNNDVIRNNSIKDGDIKNYQTPVRKEGRYGEKEEENETQIEKSSSESPDEESYENDEFQAFHLRAKLNDMKFNHVWRAMKDLGWQYKTSSSEYISPNGLNLGYSNQMLERLDSFALNPLSFRDASVVRNNNGSYDIDVNDDDGLKNARKELLMKIFSSLDPDSRRFEEYVSTSEEDDGDEHNGTTTNSNAYNDKNNKKRRNHYNNDYNVSSATMNEAGTEQYFNKSSSNKRRKRQSSRLALVQISQRYEDSTFKTDEGNDEEQQNQTSIQNKESLEKLIWPKPQENVEAIQKLRHASSNKQLELLSSNYLNKFSSQWKFLLSTNHSILFHGFGSKRFLLNEFGCTLRSWGDVLTIDGHDSSMNVSVFLDIIVALFLDGIEPSFESTVDCILASNTLYSSSAVHRATLIAQTLGLKREQPIYILIHNIDGVELRNKEFQHALAALVCDSNVVNESDVGKDQMKQKNHHVVRLAATIDNVDSPMFLWDIHMLQKFSWIWKRVDTYYPYFDEVKKTVSNETRKMKSFAKKEMIDYVFMEKVLKSIAPKHTEILKRLGELQLSKGNRSGDVSISGDKYDFVDYIEWKQKCFRQMIVTKESEFKKMMSELIDHRIIELKSDNVAGKDFVCIPTTRSKVKEILNKLNCK